MDEGVYDGWTVPNEYDPMLGKLIAWGADRQEAIARLSRALEEFYASGIKTNAGLFRRILAAREFQTGQIYTRWLDDFLREPPKQIAAPSQAELDAAALSVALWNMSKKNQPAQKNDSPVQQSRWKMEGRFEQVDRIPQRGS
jgi:acetyl-CoA carboxylase biotin carboxylase subunit